MTSVSALSYMPTYQEALITSLASTIIIMSIAFLVIWVKGCMEEDDG